MFRRFAAPLALLLSLAAEAPVHYPDAPTVPVTDRMFGESVADPYRWLEGDTRGDPRVAAWVASENATTQAYLATLPARPIFAARLRALYDFERYGVPRKAGGRYFYTYNAGLANQSALYVSDRLDGPQRLLFDPNAGPPDSAAALAEWSPSDDGARVAYSVQEAGSDWRTLHVLDVATGRVLPDELRWVKFSQIAWLGDGSGFFYSRLPEPSPGAPASRADGEHRVFLHRIGSPQADDMPIPAPRRAGTHHLARVTHDGRWLLIFSHAGTDPRASVSIAQLDGGPIRPKPLVAGGGNIWELAGAIGSTLWFVTDLGAPKQRIVALDAEHPGDPPRQVVPEGPGALAAASLVGDRLVVAYVGDARSEAELWTLSGERVGAVGLPGIGTAIGFGGRDGDSESFFSFSGFATPPTIYRYDSAANRATVLASPRIGFSPGDYVTTQIFYPSKDGTRVPMFIVRRRDLAAGPAPTLLYGYGGFGIPVVPGFSAARLAWLEQGGVLAIANLRGGGEYGEAWHDAGRRASKQNVFDDFIAAAEWLVAQRITTPRQLAIQGGSNGGLLVGVALNQRPDLFAAALPAVGVMDMLRFDRFTSGRTWIDDYGDPGVEADWRVLRAYSPYHNIRSGVDYPAILVTTADADDRVVPAHSFKYAAALQAAAIGDKPHLIRIETRAGHGSGRPLDKLIEETADQWAFIARWTGMEVGPAAKGAVSAH